MKTASPSFSLVDPVKQLQEAMENHGVEPPSTIIFDGILHRFNSNSKNASKKDGWYVAYNSAVPVAKFGHWRDLPEGVGWHADNNRELTDAELSEIHNSIKLATKAKEIEEKIRNEEASRRAQEVWNATTIAPDSHPYLVNKGITAHGLHIDNQDRLVVPITIDDKITSLQFISNKEKRFLTGGKIKGGSWSIGSNTTGTVFLCEGVATAISIHDDTNKHVVAALSANNLVAIAKQIKKTLSDDLVIVADNDKSGIGLKAATEAAAETNAKVVLIPVEGMDANDYTQAGHSLHDLLSEHIVDGWCLDALSFLDNPVSVEWLIEDWVQSNALMMVFGPSGCGKTFLVLDWCLHLTSQKENWNGKEIEHGPVFYLAGEGHIGLRARIAAWCVHHNVKPQPQNFWVSSSGTEIDTSDGYNKIIQNINRLPAKPKLIVVDTLHRNICGDENKSQDTSLVLNNCSRIMHEFKCSILLVHHTGIASDAQLRARGSSAWRGAMDIEVALIQGKEGEPIQIKQTKAKDSEITAPIQAEIKSVEIPGWLDKKEKQIKGAIITYLDIEDIEPQRKASKLDIKIKKLSEAWFMSGCGTTIIEGIALPSLTKNNFKTYLIEGLGKKSKVVNTQLSELLEDLLVSNIIKLLGGNLGYYVFDKVLASSLLMRKPKETEPVETPSAAEDDIPF